jgi:hypothetical protein
MHVKSKAKRSLETVIDRIPILPINDMPLFRLIN